MYIRFILLYYVYRDLLFIHSQNNKNNHKNDNIGVLPRKTNNKITVKKTALDLSSIFKKII